MAEGPTRFHRGTEERVGYVTGSPRKGGISSRMDPPSDWGHSRAC